MRKILLSIFTIILSSICTMAQVEDGFKQVNEFGGDEIEYSSAEMQDFLGFVLLPGPVNLMRFYEVHINYDHTIKYIQLSMDGFVHKAMGKERSNANPGGHNLFESYGIKDPNIITQLWKLRYKEYPYQYPLDPLRKPEPGWANNDKCEELPSPEQMAILKKYGITRVQDIIYGDMAFQLLKDMEDPNWVAKYSNIGSGGAVPTTNVPSDEEYAPPIDE